jgi:DMSO/TMAO reductase YedYZ heme-binding membrane subunit
MSIRRIATITFYICVAVWTMSPVCIVAHGVTHGGVFTDPFIDLCEFIFISPLKMLSFLFLMLR